MTQAQGQDPRNLVFQGLAAVLYAAAEPITASYRRQSDWCATYADSLLEDGLTGKRVLDAGCGFGTTALAIAAYAPREIICLDTSPRHLNLLETTLLKSSDLEQYLQDLGAKDSLDKYFSPTVKLLSDMRAEFKYGRFSRQGGHLKTCLASVLDLTAQSFEGNPFDAVIGNNMLHWPVNQRRGKYAKDGMNPSEALEQAKDDALTSLASVLCPGGVLALYEPIDFVRVTDKEAYDDMKENSLVNHPVFRALHASVNRLLEERHGLKRNMPSLSPLFNLDELPTLFQRNGLKLRRVASAEHTHRIVWGDALDVMFVRLPMLLGQVDIPFEDKLALANDVEQAVRASVSAQDMASPIRGQSFVFLGEKA